MNTLCTFSTKYRNCTFNGSTQLKGSIVAIFVEMCLTEGFNVDSFKTVPNRNGESLYYRGKKIMNLSGGSWSVNHIHTALKSKGF